MDDDEYVARRRRGGHLEEKNGSHQLLETLIGVYRINRSLVSSVEPFRPKTGLTGKRSVITAVEPFVPAKQFNRFDCEVQNLAQPCKVEE